MRPTPDRLRFVTYLAPSIPEDFYRALATFVCDALCMATDLIVDDRRSGPQPGGDPFTRGTADVGFMCAPCYLDLCFASPSPVELLVAPVYADPRNGGRPVYFSEVVVRRDSRFESADHLVQEGRWAFNDEGSLSGYYSILRHPAAVGHERAVLGRAVRSGSHLKSLKAVADGIVDGAAIDANVLALHLDDEPTAFDGLRVLTTIGPHPVQPVVVRSSLASDLKGRLREALLGLASAPAGRSLMARYRVDRFVPVTHSDYTRS